MPVDNWLGLLNCSCTWCTLAEGLILSIMSLQICIGEHLYKAIIGRSDLHAWFFRYLFLVEFFKNKLSQMFYKLLFLKKNR